MFKLAETALCIILKVHVEKLDWTVQGLGLIDLEVQIEKPSLKSQVQIEYLVPYPPK